ATSGPGLALMMESIGLAVAAEILILVYNVMRGGPSTGIPTKSEQSDLNIALYGLHGDAPHIVTAANSVDDCLFTMQWSVHLSEALQCPAIVLSDQAQAQARLIIDHPADFGFAAKRVTVAESVKNYHRYQLTETGVSPMAIPGVPGGEYVAEGLEHTQDGTPSAQAERHLEQLEKRQRTLTAHDFGAHWADIAGQGSTAILTWGYSGDPDGAADLIVKEVRHKGFSFLQVLSPCVTYHPEQREWKKQVRPAPAKPAVDPVRASMRLLDEEGFNIGVLFVSDRPPYAPHSAPKATLAGIEKTFAI
ncbi:MAG TPA: hypothetical protein ENI79_00950, partial [Rhodospirillales bacterium]|nr:hypothetical protein [Rhodospirillales bacterium]